MLQFLHHNELVEEAVLPADLTVLDYLRERRNQCGTKEGCASGDCGACTVVIAELAQNEQGDTTLNYRSANSCITFAGSLHGKQLITVENLTPDSGVKTTKGNLHTSQKTLVENHASQCGFCTPGFVMSLFAAMKTKARSETTRAYIDEQFGGNLCRCTGYRPIIHAAKDALRDSSVEDQFDLDAQQTIKSLQAIAGIDSNDVDSNAVSASTAHGESLDTAVVSGVVAEQGFFRPSSINELYILKKIHPGAAVLAGGTDLALSVTQQLNTIEKIIYTGMVNELSWIKETADGICIGAGTRLTEFRQAIVQYFPEMDSLLSRFAGTQVRNQATVGGNFANASPVGDLPPVFIALNASMVLASARGERTVKAQEFFVSYKNTLLEPDEIIREFVLPRSAYVPGNNLRLENRFYKISKRLDDDISAVCAAFHLVLDGNLIVEACTGFGGMAEIPKRALALEAALTERILDEQCIADAAIALQQDFQPIDDVRATAVYRSKVSANLLRRLAAELYTPEVATTVVQHDH